MLADGLFVAGEFGDALLGIQLHRYAECRAQQDALWAPLDDQFVVGLETEGLAKGCGNRDHAPPIHGDFGLHKLQYSSITVILQVLYSFRFPRGPKSDFP